MTDQQRRDAAFHAIETERDYQDAHRGNAAVSPMRKDEINRMFHDDVYALTLGEGILCMERILHQAREKWYHPDQQLEMMDDIRKVAGVATQLMENFGAPPREAPVVARSISG